MKIDICCAVEECGETTSADAMYGNSMFGLILQPDWGVVMSGAFANFYCSQHYPVFNQPGVVAEEKGIEAVEPQHDFKCSDCEQHNGSQCGETGVECKPDDEACTAFYLSQSDRHPSLIGPTGPPIPCEERIEPVTDPEKMVEMGKPKTADAESSKPLPAEIPGMVALHAVITENCRRIQGGDVEALWVVFDRILDEYNRCIAGWAGKNPQPDFHVVLTVERKDKSNAS